MKYKVESENGEVDAPVIRKDTRRRLGHRRGVIPVADSADVEQ